MQKLLNFVLFQLGWFACVLGGAYQMPLAGSLAALVIIAIYLTMVDTSFSEIKLLSVALIIGLIFESALVSGGLAIYSSGQLIDNMAPVWMILMWPLFATTINQSMGWMKNLHITAVVLAGAIAAPLAYYAGFKLGAVEFPDITASLAVISLSWAVLLPILLSAAKSFSKPVLQDAIIAGGKADV
jgi:hypothetical protein